MYTETAHNKVPYGPQTEANNGPHAVSSHESWCLMHSLYRSVCRMSLGGRN